MHQRRVLFLGFLLFLLAMIEGAFVQRFANPRLALSAHVGGAMSGLFLIALGAVWQHVRLSARTLGAAGWTAVAGMYLSTGGLVLAALYDTRNSTPIAGAAQPAEPCKESLVTGTLGVGAVAVFLALVLVLVGLRGRAE